jgi:hypothetical protein
VTMSSSVITINAVPLPPAVPTASSTIQPTLVRHQERLCFELKQGLSSLDGTHISPRIRSQLAPNDYTLYVRNTADATCVMYRRYNNKYCATSSCGSNGISYGSAYLCYTIRNNHNNNSIRS